MNVNNLDPDEFLTGEAVSFVSAALDLVSNGQFSIAIKALKTLQKAVVYREKFHIKKLIAVFDELNKKLANSDPVLLGQALSNLKNKYGQDTVEQSFYSAIERSETVERAQMVGRLLANSTLEPKILNHYADILYVINNLGLDDFEYLSDAIKSSLEVKGNHQRNRDLYIKGVATKFTVSGYMEHFTPSRLRRFNAVGLCKQSMLIEDNTIYYVDEIFGNLVLKAIQ